jgi:hypothetical protein
MDEALLDTDTRRVRTADSSGRDRIRRRAPTAYAAPDFEAEGGFS